METKYPRVGVTVFLFNEKNEILFGKRKGSHGAGTYAVPGGHLDFGETFEKCAVRELFEETDLKMNEEDFFFITVTNNVFEDRHYVDIALIARIPEGQKIINVEPEKNEGWFWVDYNNIPEEILNNLFPVTKNIFETAGESIEEYLVLTEK